jgi:hypothetical protein
MTAEAKAVEVWQYHRRRVPHNHAAPLPEHAVQAFFERINQIRDRQSAIIAKTHVDEFREMLLHGRRAKKNE